MRIVFVVAAARNGVIGRDGQMPWHLPADLKHFKAMTMGKPMIMGRKTFQSIGRALPGRDTIVITRQAAFTVPGVHVAGSWDAALSIARRLADGRGVDEITVVGGAEIYRLALSVVDRVYLTEIDLEPDGDSVFAPLDPDLWTETAREDYPARDGRPAYRFRTLDRVRAGSASASV